jgi:predicted enzyme related to lactoylglutathione lyase
MSPLVDIDADDLHEAIRFYTAAFALCADRGADR